MSNRMRYTCKVCIRERLMDACLDSHTCSETSDRKNKETRANTLHPPCTVDLTLHLSPLICHICLLVIFIVPPALAVLKQEHVITLSLAEHPARSLLSPRLSAPSRALALHLPSFSPSLFPPPSSSSSSSSSSRCALDSLSFPLAHPLRQHPPLSTSTFTLTSSRLPLSAPLHHLLTHIISGNPPPPPLGHLTRLPSTSFPPPHPPPPLPLLHLSVVSPPPASPSTLSFISSIPPPSLFTHSTSPSHACTHTHADWQPRTEHPLSRTGNQAVCSRTRASWHWVQLRKRTRKRPWSTATSSLFFPQTGAPGARGSIPLRLPRDALWDRCPSSTTASCSVSACRVRHVEWLSDPSHHVHVPFCVNCDWGLRRWVAGVTLCFLNRCACRFEWVCVAHSCSGVSLTHCWFVILTLWQSLVHAYVLCMPLVCARACLFGVCSPL